ncbi:VOC family protein [Nocardioides houyundeii]|uniref:VOC family protein n=1 Tax=Nocardioides houyundeii TaxID=2045452 RepID=UPI000DF18F6E|nr:VOC family protein [Nocardioides houyundeii]
MPVARIASINLECPDPVVLAGFWAALLGGEVAVETPDFCAVKVDSIYLGAVRVQGYLPPTWPSAERSQQLHLDLAVEDLDAAEEEALRLGATKEPEQPSPERSRVLRDPAGHPFCLRA